MTHRLTPPSCCPGCLGRRLRAGPAISVEILGQYWARDRAGSTYLSPNAFQLASNDWTNRIQTAIGTEHVQFYRCEECEVEISTPAAVWPEGTYTEDENYPIRWEFNRYLEDLGDTPMRILELGCGQGSFLKLATSKGHQAIGLDFNAKAVDIAKANGLAVRFGGFEKIKELQTDETRFDGIALFHVIEHLPNPELLLQQLIPYIRKGTLIGVSCPSPVRFTKLIKVQQIGGKDFWDFPPHHVLRWTSIGLQKLLSRNGWEVISSIDEPFVLRDAASQLGVQTANWKGYAHLPIVRRLGILSARIQLLLSQPFLQLKGLSLYTLARYRGN